MNNLEIRDTSTNLEIRDTSTNLEIRDNSNNYTLKIKDIINEYDFIESVNYYTFIDNIKDYNIKIKNFFFKNKQYERIIYYNTEQWLLFLIESFKKDKDKKSSVWNQYIKDSNRCYIEINKYKLYNTKDIIKYINIYDISYQYYILIILTQVVFFIPYFLLQNNIKNNINNTNNLIVSEISDLDMKRFNINKTLKYNCYFNTEINIQIHKYLRVFDYKNNRDNTICLIKVFIEFNLLNNKYSIIKFKFIPVY